MVIRLVKYTTGIYTLDSKVDLQHMGGNSRVMASNKCSRPSHVAVLVRMRTPYHYKMMMMMMMMMMMIAAQNNSSGMHTAASTYTHSSNTWT
jgi:hypothetical protein